MRIHTAQHRLAQGAKKGSRRVADRCDRCPWAPSNTPGTGRVRRDTLSDNGTPAHTSNSVNTLLSGCLSAACFHALLSIVSWPCSLPSGLHFLLVNNLEVYEIMITLPSRRQIVCRHHDWSLCCCHLKMCGQHYCLETANSLLRDKVTMHGPLPTLATRVIFLAEANHFFLRLGHFAHPCPCAVWRKRGCDIM